MQLATNGKATQNRSVGQRQFDHVAGVCIRRIEHRCTRVDDDMFRPSADDNIASHDPASEVNFADRSVASIRHIDNIRIGAEGRVIRHAAGRNIRRQRETRQVNHRYPIARGVDRDSIAPVGGNGGVMHGTGDFDPPHDLARRRIQNADNAYAGIRGSDRCIFAP